MRVEPDGLPYGPDELALEPDSPAVGPDGQPCEEEADVRAAPTSGPVVTRRTVLLGLGATTVLAGLGVVAAAPAAAESSPAPSACRQLITVNTGSSRATTGSLSTWSRSAD